MLKATIQSDMKSAMKAGEKRRLGVIRLLLAAIKQREVDERIELDDTQVLVVLDKMVIQRRDSISQFEQAGRTDLAEQEAYEIEVLKVYLPEALSEEEDMGKVMGQLKPKMQGRADMGAVSALIKQQLGG